jgi:septal ring factor EnvC (AmiA/AmiB activator)
MYGHRPNDLVRTHHRRTYAALALFVAAAALAVASPAAGQQRQIDRQIRDNRSRLDQIRQERENLQSQLDALRGRARDISSELGIIDQQRTATSRRVNELDRQMAGLTSQVDTITFDLILAEDAYAEKQAVLDRRITEIYKRGRLWVFEVLLAAESFGDLLSRYKYLYMVSRQDRTLKDEVQLLGTRIALQRRDLVNVRTTVGMQRMEREVELREFVNLERERQRALANIGRTERAATTRLDSLAADENQLNTVIASLERARRNSASRGGETVAPTISVTDVGTLAWPVDGPVLYKFGPKQFRDGTSIRYQGIGIGAPIGTPVRAVRSGVVASATDMGTWGPTIIVQHGDGYYTVYAHLSRLDVVADQRITDGESIGLSGGAGSDEGPHIEFQIRQTPEGASSAWPVALDPESWLRRR